MADVLSQSQIDELLKNLSGGGASATVSTEENNHKSKLKQYDFKMPKKFTKEQLKGIHDVYESFSRHLASYLTSSTRFFCTASVLQIEEQRYYEFNNALQDYTIMGNYTASFDPDDDILDAKFIIQFSNVVTFSLLDRLLGGKGSLGDDISRDFTEIEVRIMKNTMEKMGEIFREVWAQYMSISTSLVSLETNARVNQPISADEIIVLVTIEVEFNETKNIITIAMPAISVEAMMNKVGDRYSRNTRRYDAARENERREYIRKSINSSFVNIDAILAETQVELSDILSLKPDDVIMLDMPISKDISILVNDNPWFGARLGSSNNKKAFKISNITNSRS